MLEKLIGNVAPVDHASSALAWKWAFEHPLLHTFIEVSGPSLYVVIVIAGAAVVRGLFRGRA